MAIYKKGKNWYIDYYYKGKRKRKKVGHSKRLAEQVLKDVHVKIAKGEYLGVYEEKKILFEDYAQQYLDYSKANKALSSYHRDQLSIGHLTSTFKGGYLFDITSEMIEKYKAMRLEKELTVLLQNSNGEYVFSDRNGRPFFGDIKKGFSAALKRAGIEDFRFHDLRHTFGSHLVMQGVNVRTIQQLMGHKDIKMTMRYSHLSPEYVQQAVERLDNLWTLFGHQNKFAEDLNLIKA